MTQDTGLEPEHDETLNPEIPAEDLQAELEAARAEAAALKDQVMRFAAEAENTKRRAEREMNDARAFAIQRFSRDLLGVADILARAVSAVPVEITDPAFKNFVAGIEMTEKELTSAFDRNGVKKISPLSGDRFDPNLHQAVTEQTAPGVAPGAVISTMQAGYELFGRVIRPAMVVVSAKIAAPAANGADAHAAPSEEYGRDVDTPT